MARIDRITKNNLKQIMTERGITVEVLSLETGVGISTICNIRKGAVGSLSSVYAICDYLGIGLYEFLFGCKKAGWDV